MRLLWILLGLISASPALADQVRVAVAANFTAPARELATLFKARSGHEVVLSFGSSGQLFAQITQAAPFDVFLSADAERPERLVRERLAAADSRFTYSIGKLILWSRDRRAEAGELALRQPFEKIAIANPAAAPYGGAALDVLRNLGLLEQLRRRIVQGTSIAQTFQFVESGNAELGFIALSQLEGRTDGGRWLVPPALHGSLQQDAVLLTRGQGNKAATEFLNFLKSTEARALISRFGYELAP
jgi:molybdate transport system substrate-binding protein